MKIFLCNKTTGQIDAVHVNVSQDDPMLQNTDLYGEYTVVIAPDSKTADDIVMVQEPISRKWHPQMSGTAVGQINVSVL